LNIVVVSMGWLLGNGNLISQTPPGLSYQSEAVVRLWRTVCHVANGGLAVVTVWSGVNLITRAIPILLAVDSSEAMCTAAQAAPAQVFPDACWPATSLTVSIGSPEQLSARLLETEAVVEDFAFKSVPARLAGALLRLVETSQDQTLHASH
jgi:hypothetical protein